MRFLNYFLCFVLMAAVCGCEKKSESLPGVDKSESPSAVEQVESQPAVERVEKVETTVVVPAPPPRPIEEEGHVERFGRKVDRALDKAGHAVGKGLEKAGEEVEEATDKLHHDDDD